MHITKQEMTLNEIIHSVTSGKKKSGEFVFMKEYTLAPKQMGIIFKILVENDIVSRTKSNGYILTENCKENAQELYLSKISDSLRQIMLLADAASISQEILIDFINSEIKEQNK